MKDFKSAFTMIELIFVIVIIGILATVAIPKLMATRDDAKVSTMMMDIGNIINEITTYTYSKANAEKDLSKMSNTISNMVANNRADLNVSDSLATIKMGGVECVKIKIDHNATNDDLNISLVNGVSNALCKYLQKEILSKTYKIKLRGNSIKF